MTQTPPNTPTNNELDKLDDEIAYENAMYENALAYPTETAQFYNALEDTRKRIEGLYAKRDKLLAQLKAKSSK